MENITKNRKKEMTTNQLARSERKHQSTESRRFLTALTLLTAASNATNCRC